MGIIKHITILSAILVLFVQAIPAQNITIQGFPGSIVMEYQLDSEVFTISNFTLQHRGDAVDYFITFSPGTSGSFIPRKASGEGSAFINYQIYDNMTTKNILKDLSASPSTTEVLSGSFPQVTQGPPNRATVSFSTALVPGQFPLAGQYTDSVEVRLYAGTPASPGNLISSNTTTISITMEPVLEISLVQADFSFSPESTSLTLDFGILSAGSSRAADLLVRSNAPYSVSVVSAGGGLLSPQDTAETSTIPYRFISETEEIPLQAETPRTFVSGAPSMSSEGTRHSVTFKIRDFGMATEGVYTDILTFTVSAN